MYLVHVRFVLERYRLSEAIDYRSLKRKKLIFSIQKDAQQDLKIYFIYDC